MSQILRESYPLGWDPSQDEYNGDPRALLRADNITLDDKGVLALRSGSSRVWAAGGSELDVHSLFACLIDYTRYRVAGIDNSVYVNGARRQESMAGTGQIFFGTDKKQIFWARGETRRKYDGATVREWGIERPSGVATLSALDPREKSIMEFGSGISAATYAADEGSIVVGIAHDGTSNGSQVLTPNGTTLRSSATFQTPGLDLSRFGATPGANTDLFEIYIWVQDPKATTRIALMLDLSGSGTPAEQFKDDYFKVLIEPDEPTDIAPSVDELLAARPIAPVSSVNPVPYSAAEGGTQRSNAERLRASLSQPQNANGSTVGAPTSQLAVDKPTSSAVGWRKISIPRSKWERVGTTPGAGWATVSALRIVVLGNGSVGFDEFYLRGGEDRALTGKFYCKCVYVYNSGIYTEKSGPSDESAAIDLKTNGLVVTIPAAVVAEMDSQVNEIWVYLWGGGLDRYYRFAIATNVVSGSSITIPISISALDAAEQNIVIEDNNARPPEDILGICGPFKNRMFVITSRFLYISRINNPGSFALNQIYAIGNEGEQGVWIVATDDAVYLGSTRTVYRISGSMAEFPDGSVDINIKGLGADPATTTCYAADGNALMYLAPESLMTLNGGGSAALRGSIDHLQRGKTRYGVPGWNLGYSPGLAAAALLNRYLYVLAPEVANYSTAVYRMDVDSGRWERYTYFSWDATRGFRSLYREPNGLLLAGDNKGQVWQLEDSSVGDDSRTIPFLIWTLHDHGGLPENEKHGFDLHTRCLLDGAGTGRQPPASAYYTPHTSTCLVTPWLNSAERTDLAVSVTDVTAAKRTIAVDSEFRTIQLRITGSAWEFRWYGWGIPFRPRPTARVYWDSGYFDAGSRLTWIRQIRFQARGGDASVLVTVWFDGVAKASTTVALTENVETLYHVPVGRAWHGRTARIEIRSVTSPSGASGEFELYWVDVLMHQTGTGSGKDRIRFSAAEA